jgi:hypothetical protein
MFMERRIGDYWKEQEGSKTIWYVKGFNNVVTFFYRKRDAKLLAKDLLKVAKQYK